MQVLPSFENLFSATGYIEQAPQLSQAYAEYDNGANVFTAYSNFVGTNLPSDFTSYIAGLEMEMKVQDGITTLFHPLTQTKVGATVYMHLYRMDNVHLEQIWNIIGLEYVLILQTE